MSLGEALRREAKSQYESGEMQLSAWRAWNSAADYIDTMPQGPHIDPDAFAEALRYENVEMNGHPSGVWEELPEQNRELWMKKVERVQKAIAHVIERRNP